MSQYLAFFEQADAHSGEIIVRPPPHAVDDQGRPKRSYLTHLSQKINRARADQRKTNASIFRPGDALYGKSPYDGYVLSIKEDERGPYLHISRTGAISKFIIEKTDGTPLGDMKRVEGSAEAAIAAGAPPEDIF